ncbi:hypothetical protein EAT49_15860 [Histidinibacterium lentulum]|uniref:Uncharacterized protein n=1 Tax=Histidinibacterium lentulum TaxID=2480588 RepID=A0A3N2QV26_9RHOB|nr:hypothetical protein EAT49_15860 [Histidinibacterium lentulum]
MTGRRTNPPSPPLPKGTHRVRRQTLSGDRWHFYAWRGGPNFWAATRATRSNATPSSHRSGRMPCSTS